MFENTMGTMIWEHMIGSGHRAAAELRTRTPWRHSYTASLNASKRVGGLNPARNQQVHQR